MPFAPTACAFRDDDAAKEHDAWVVAELALANNGAVAQGQRPRQVVRCGCTHEPVTKVVRHVASSVTSMPHGSRVRSRVLVFDRFLISLA